MNKYGNAAVTAKRVVGNKIVYKLEKDDYKEWVDYQDLIDHLDLVIAYEKQLKGMKGQVRKQTKKAQEGQGINSLEGLDPNGIASVQFVDKYRGNLLFRTQFKNGQVFQLTNKQLRTLNPTLLLDFYEKHVQVGFDI